MTESQPGETKMIPPRKTSSDGYVELHSRSAFSFLEGASLPEALMARCSELGQSAMALADSHGVYGAPRFHMAAKKLGIRALIGAEIAVSDDCRYTLLAENQKGYQNICRLLTKIKLRDGRNRKPKQATASDEDLAEFADGLVCLTGGGEGPFPAIFSTHPGAAAKEKANAQLEKLVNLFGQRNVYVELQRHRRRNQEARNRILVELARERRLPLLATNGVSHATVEEHELQDVLTCIKNRTSVAEAGRRLSYNAHRHLKSSAEMKSLFADFPEAVAETSELAARLNFTLKDLGYEFPHYPVEHGETEMSFLRKRTDEGARNRYRPYSGKARAQIERELALIETLDLPGYFLIVWDVVQFCKQNGILVQGRGSAANSAVCYALGITAVDPIEMNLLFERFLSEQRGEWPDIDLDLPSDSLREEAIQYVYKRYGELGAAMTANVITYRGRSAVRDVGKALGFEERELKRLADLMPQFEWKDPKDTLERRFREAGLPPYDPRIIKFFSLTNAILDLPRHLSQHSGGMVVCQGQLNSVVPLEPAAMPGRVVVQWDKDDCADMKIVKIDLLGLGMMAVLQDCLAVIPQHYGETVDLAHLPQNDAKVYSTLQKADTLGLFQVESRAQQAVLPRMMPKCFYDIVIQVAIIRPGPIVGNMLHPFLRRRQELEKPVSLHSSLDKVLARTLGIPLFQEQLLKMAMIVASFTGGEAEELRRAMGFKRSEQRMRLIEAKLRAGMTKNNIDREAQERIVQAITSFALYGFPESHAASFALIAYASAYLKCHYLAAFTICLLNNQPMGFYSPATLVKDAQRHGQRFRAVSIEHSEEKCTIEHGDGILFVRLGFNYVRGLRSSTAQSIVVERQKKPFSSLRDLMLRVPELNKKEMAVLSEIGALNCLPKNKADRHRRGAMWQASAAVRNVGPLLEAAAEEGAPSPLAPLTPEQRIYSDFTHSGLTIGKHPVTFYREELRALGICDAETAKARRNGAIVTVAGCVITRQRPGTAKGFVFLTLEDETGTVNVIVNPKLFERYRRLCVSEPYLMIKGTLQNIWNVISLKAGYIEALPLNGPLMPSHNFH